MYLTQAAINNKNTQFNLSRPFKTLQDHSRIKMPTISKNTKPWSVAEFEKYRPELTGFIRKDVMPLLEEDGCRRIVIRAPVKSGKREIVEYIAMRDGSSSPHRIHVFISAWHRTADNEQRVELAKHNLSVFSIVDTKKADACIDWLNLQIANNKEVVIHLDECDHGSGKKQLLSKVWSVIRANNKITSILYSATPQEVLFSGEVEDSEYLEMIDDIKQGHCVEYSPDPKTKFCGPKKFLQHDRVIDARPFFYPTTMELSPQGKEIVINLKENLIKDPRRNIVILRLAYSQVGGKNSERKENKAIYQFLKNLASFPELSSWSITVDKGDNSGLKSSPLYRAEVIQWSSRQYWEDKAINKPMLIVIDQTSSRSTEWACHDRIFATHDFRNKITFSVISQAQERVNHYEEKYGGFQPIFVYGHKKTFMLSASKIDYEAYLARPWVARKVDKRTSHGEVMWHIKENKVGGKIHPSYPFALSAAASDLALQDLGSFGDVDISARVAGRIVNKPVFNSAWYPATKDSWSAAHTKWIATAPISEVTRSKVMHNPFEQPEAIRERLPNGIWKGLHFGGWTHLNYETDIVGKEGFGVNDTHSARRKICYKDGVLGVAFCWIKGTEKVKTLKSIKSMYSGM
jgi:hypothetical protein